MIEHVPVELHGALFERVAGWVRDDGFVFVHYPDPHHLEWTAPQRARRSCSSSTSRSTPTSSPPTPTAHGLYLERYERYSIWVREGDYVIAVLRPAAGVGEFHHLPAASPLARRRAPPRACAGSPARGTRASGSDAGAGARAALDLVDLRPCASPTPAASPGWPASWRRSRRAAGASSSSPRTAARARAAALPANVEVRRPRLGSGRARGARSCARCARPRRCGILARTLRRRSNWSPYLRGARSYLDLLAGELLKAGELAAWIEREGLGEAIFYDYWFENSTLALALLRRRGAVRCAVARAHRYDVFDFAWGRLGRVPFREFKAAWLDAVFAVSEDGAAYLRARFGGEAEKVRVARLGVPLPPSYPRQRPDPPLVVSCSSLNRRKRVDAIPAVLRRLRAAAALAAHRRRAGARAGSKRRRRELPDGGRAGSCRGRIDNDAVRELYAARPVSAFLSLSSSEGVPVSMMEALSFGVPVVALAVGGVGELVTAEAGTALAPDASPERVAAALAEALEPGRFDAERVRAAFAARFEAPRDLRGVLRGVALAPLGRRRARPWRRASQQRGEPLGVGCEVAASSASIGSAPPPSAAVAASTRFASRTASASRR